MWITDLCRAILLATVVVAACFGLLTLPLLIGLAFLLGIGGILFDTAAAAYLPELLNSAQKALEAANARLQGVQLATSYLIGPPSGSALFALGRMIPLVADAVSFLFSSLMMRSLPKSAPKPGKVKGSLLKEARQGASYLVHHRVLLGLAIRPAVNNFAFSAMWAVLVVFARQMLHLSTFGYGFLLVTDSTGGLAGTAVGTRLGRKLGVGTVMTLAASVEALAILGLGLSDNAYEAGAFMAACGAGIGVTLVLGPSIRQAIVPAELMGRVVAANRLVAFCAIPAGAILGGWLAGVAGIRAPFIVGAGVLASMTVLVGTMTSNQKIDAALAKAKRTDTVQLR